MASCVSDYDWYSKFSEDCKEILNLPIAHIQPAAVHDMNICHVKELILGNRQIIAHGTASSNGIWFGSVEEIILELLLFKKVCA
jgi:hypothetical protein